MKKLIAFVSLASLQMTPLMAHTGGPWSNNLAESHTNGIFGGIMTGSNLSGTFRFTVTDTAQLGALNASAMYYKGVTYVGSCQADIDFDAKKISGLTNGSAYNRSPAAANGTAPPLNDNGSSGTAGVYTVPIRPTVQNGNAVRGNFTFVNAGVSGPVGTGNSVFDGKLTATSPNIRFKAKGQATFFGDQTVTFRPQATETDASIVQFEFVPDGGTDPVTINVPVPGVVTEATVERGGNDPFPNFRNKVKIRVFGSRRAYNPSASIGGTGTGLVGTGGGAFSF